MKKKAKDYLKAIEDAINKVESDMSVSKTDLIELLEEVESGCRIRREALSSGDEE